MNNPYSISFGNEPGEIISRGEDIDQMVRTFSSESPSTTTYIITGIRGSGKTVTLSKIIEKLREDNSWIVVTLNQNRNLLEALAANLYEHPLLKASFIKTDIRVSFVADIPLRNDGPTTDVEVQLKRCCRLSKR